VSQHLYSVEEVAAKINKSTRWVRKLCITGKLAEFLQFRIRFLQEELTELQSAQSGDDAVDALIDLCVVAIGTLNAFDVNSFEAWDRVLAANMAKEVGVKASRPNPLGLPDLIKPEGWTAPTHVDNIGLFAKIY